MIELLSPWVNAFYSLPTWIQIIMGAVSLTFMGVVTFKAFAYCAKDEANQS